jgi:enamine deaminase RidA (YjgF/YER057c/UK114 family)
MQRAPLTPEDHWTWRGDAYAYLSQGWRIGDLIYTGGQVALAEDGTVIAPGDVAVQTRVVYQNIERVLALGGATLADVFKINSFYVCHGDADELATFWETMARARGEFFRAPGPCGTGVRVEGLVYDGLVIEVEAVAALGGNDRRGEAADV